MDVHERRLTGGGLWERLRAVTATALSSGALVSIATERAQISQGGVDFQVRVAANLRRKDAARRAALDSAFDPEARTPVVNPFLPYDEALYVGHIGPEHVALLNKFNVMDHHLLLVTRAFEAQHMLITPADFAALWSCLKQVDGLGFYNGGEEAGASQPHKHLQLVPLPLSPSGPTVPMEPALHRPHATGEIAVSPALSFAHAFSPLDGLGQGGAASVESIARELHRRYLALLSHVGLSAPTPRGPQPGPYNLLVTRRWMLLVPRLREHFDGISLNGLAFAGSLFVRNRGQLEALRAAGPMQALARVCGVAGDSPPRP